MDHFGAEKAVPDLAEQAHATTFVAHALELLGLAAVEIQITQRKFAAFVGHADHQLPAGAKLYRHIDHARLDLNRHAVGRGSDRHHGRLILVTQRQMQDQIVVARKTQLGQFVP